MGTGRRLALALAVLACGCEDGPLVVEPEPDGAVPGDGFDPSCTNRVRDGALAQLWLFWVAPIIGGAVGGWLYRTAFEEV